MARRVTFTEDGARRVADAVRAYERGNRDMPGVRLRTATDDDHVRIGTISATWPKGSTATVTEEFGDGSPKTATVTFEATNHMATLTVNTGTMRVACGRVDSTWVLIGWDWHDLPGYVAGDQQVLVHAANGGLEWIGTTDCDGS